MQFGGRADMRSCVGCGVRFQYWGKSDYAQFCYDCRSELGIKTDADAKQILEIIERVPVSEWEKQQAESIVLRTKRQPVWQQPAPQGQTKALQRTGPPPDPMKVAAAIRSQVQYGLTTEDDLTTLRATAYVLAKNGLFEVRRAETVDIVVQQSDKPVIGLVKELQSGVTWNIPKMPYAFLQQTVALFRETCVRKGGSNEAFVRIWWNVTEKTYSIQVPQQHVSGGGVQHTDTFDQMPSGEWVAVADIHSHGSGMGAFFSGVDDHDERQAPEGRVCGVIGKVNQPLPEWKWRLRTREGFIDLSVTDCFNFAVVTGAALPFTVTLKNLFDSASESTNVKDGQVRLFCPVDPFHDATCPEEWHTCIGTRPHQGGLHVSHAGGGTASQHAYPDNRVQYVFIRDGNTLVEWEVQGTTRKTTGKTFSLVPSVGSMLHEHVH